MKRTIRDNFWLRTLLVFGVLFVVYAIFILIPRIRLHAKQQLPSKALVEFRAAVNQDYLSYQQLANQTSKDPSIAITLVSAQQSMTISHKAFQQALSHPPQQIKQDEDLLHDLRQADKLQTKLLALYAGRYNALIKPLQYIPADDLTTKQISVNRAQTTSKALLGFAANQPLALKMPDQDNIPSPSIAVQGTTGSFQISAKTRAALQASAECFAKFAQQLKVKSSTASKTLRACTTQYELTRQQITASILKPLRGTDGKGLQTSLVKSLERIDKKL